MRRPTALSLAAWGVAVIAGVWVIAAQPVGAPWWIHADADGPYTGSSLNLAVGGHTKYFDHPGLPLQEAGATGFIVWHAAERLTGSPGSLHEFASRMMLDLDRARPLYRGIAIILYLLGVTAAFLVAACALGHPLWGLTGAMLWLGSPGLLPMSIEFRPDVLLSWLVLIGGFLIVRGYQRRDPLLLLGAAAVTGFTVMVKLHAVGLLPPLLLASLLAGPFPGWPGRLRAALRRRRTLVVLAAAAWAALAVYFDSSRLSSHVNVKGLALIAASATLAGAWLLVGRVLAQRVPSRVASAAGDFNGALVAAFVLGLLVPVVIVLDDGVQAVVWTANAALGRGVNEGIGHFTDWGSLLHFPLLGGLVVYVLAGVGAIVGLGRRDWSPLLWFLASTGMTLLAIERIGTTHYFAPGYALAIVPALGLLQRLRPAGPALAVALAVVVIWPQFEHRGDERRQAEALVRAGTATEASLASRLGPHEIALTSADAFLPDTLYNRLVEIYVLWTPPYPYRTMPQTAEAEWSAGVLHLKPRLYLTTVPLPPSGAATISTGDYVVRSAPVAPVGEYHAYRIVSGPGIDRPAPTTPPPGAPAIEQP